MKKTETPTKAQMYAVTHSVLDSEPSLANDAGELAEAVKCACARSGFVYDGHRITLTIEAVLFIRQRRIA